MCLGIPGQIVELMTEHEHLARVNVSGVRRVTTAHQTRTLDPTVPNHRRHVRLHVLDEKQRATAKRAAAVDELMAIIHVFLR